MKSRRPVRPPTLSNKSISIIGIIVIAVYLTRIRHYPVNTSLEKRRHHTCCFIHLRGIIYFLILSLNVHWMDRRIRDKQYSAPKNNSARYSRGIIKNRYNRTDRQNSQNHYFDNFSNYPYIRTRVLLSNTNSSHLFSPLLHCRVRIQNRKTQSKPIQPINIRRNPKTHSSPYCHPPFRSTYLCPQHEQSFKDWGSY